MLDSKQDRVHSPLLLRSCGRTSSTCVRCVVTQAARIAAGIGVFDTRAHARGERSRAEAWEISHDRARGDFFSPL